MVVVDMKGGGGGSNSGNAKKDFFRKPSFMQSSVKTSNFHRSHHLKELVDTPLLQVSKYGELQVFCIQFLPSKLFCRRFLINFMSVLQISASAYINSAVHRKIA